MSDYDYKQSEEVAWIRLVHTSGIGAKRAWGIYYILRDADRCIADVFTDPEASEIIERGLSPALAKRLHQSEIPSALDRYRHLQQSAIHLLHPESDELEVPDGFGLPPTITFWGDLSLLNSPDIEVLLKSRQTDGHILTSFLQSVAIGKIPRRIWCFCPFSKLEWELVESLLKVGCGLILGLPSGITSRIINLAKDNPEGTLVALAPEPPARNRSVLFNTIEAFYNFFFAHTGRTLVLYMSPRGKTAARLKRAMQADCQVVNFSAEYIQRREIDHQPDKPTSGIQPGSPADDDDEFITCL
jgi:hypothetical protein